MQNKLIIPKPCDKKWSSMTPMTNGRFCDFCDKTVIDFTKMKQPEIKKYFIENSGKEKICGHFKFNQIETNEKFNNLFNKIKIKPLKAVAMLCLSSFFALVSCIGKTVDGEPSPIPNDEINDKVQSVKIKSDSITAEIKQIKKQK